MLYQNILVIDDDIDDLEIFSVVLDKLSEKVQYTSFTDAGEALSMLIGREINPDVIFLDLNMPRMSGEQFLSRVKENEHLKNIPVIVLSSSSNPETIKLTRSLGAIDFITKPHSLAKFTGILVSKLKSG